MSSLSYAILSGGAVAVVLSLVAWYYHRKSQLLQAQLTISSVTVAQATQDAQRQAEVVAAANAARDADQLRREQLSEKEDEQVVATNDSTLALSRLHDALTGASTAAGTPVPHPSTTK